ncbi:MAG: peptidoglycan-binding domain-containing protein [Ferrovibrio sp.]
MSLLPLASDQPNRPTPTGNFGDLFRFTGAIGPEAANARDDVIRAQILLGESGDLDLDSLGGPTGWPGGELTRGLKRYQRRKGLTVDGLMLPDGETITALQDDLYDRLARYRTPTTAEVDRFHDRLARYRTDGNDDVKRPRIELERLDGGTLPYALRSGADTSQSSGVQSDIDFDQSPAFTSGAQVAQIAPPVHPGASIAGIAGAAQHPYGVTPAEAKAGQQIDKWFEEKVNLLGLPWQMYQGLTNGQSPATSSPPMDPKIEAAGKTPPLKPSAPEEEPPEGSKAEEREPTLEELIPPDMKPWVEGLEPFDQQLARELMLIYNRRGGPETIKGNAIIVKEMMDALKKYPALADEITHVGGSHSAKNGQPGDDDENNYLKERHYLKSGAPGERKGGSWADMTFEVSPALGKELGIEYLHLSSAKLLKDGKTAISDEREKQARLEKNHPVSRVEIVEKPVATRIDGRKIPYDWESYQARIRDFAERLARDLEATRVRSKP